MAGLSDMLENYRNWRGRQEWQDKKGWQDFYGGDFEAQERAERMMGLGTGAHGISGIAGTFAGLKSLTANRAAWNKAQLAEKLGKPAESTWLEHGWGRPEYDPQWRYEIPDEMSKIKNPEAFNTTWEKFRDAAEKEKYGRRGASPMEMSRKEFSEYNKFSNDIAKRWNEINPHRSRVGDILEHPELFKAYPELANLEVLQVPASTLYKGSLSRIGENGTPWINLRENLSADEARSTLLHELQHAIQKKEGFATGGEVEDFLKMINPETGTNYTLQEAIEKYRRLGGEVEARLTQHRLDYGLPGQRGLLYPWERSQIDVPINEIGDPRGLTGLLKK